MVRCLATSCHLAGQSVEPGVGSAGGLRWAWRAGAGRTRGLQADKRTPRLFGEGTQGLCGHSRVTKGSSSRSVYTATTTVASTDVGARSPSSARGEGIVSDQPPLDQYGQQDPREPQRPPYAPQQPYGQQSDPQGQPQYEQQDRGPYQGQPDQDQPPHEGQPDGPPGGQPPPYPGAGHGYGAPPSGPQPPRGHRRRRRHLVRNILAGTIAVIVAIIVISVLASHGSGGSAASSSGPSATRSSPTASPPAISAAEKACHNRPDASGDIYVRMIKPGVPTQVQELSGEWRWDSATSKCLTSVQFMIAAAPRSAGNCTQVGYAADNPGYHPTATSPKPLKNVVARAGPAC
jgi:hypothetical protein